MMTTTNSKIKNRLYPGLTCASIEFFVGHNGRFKVMSSGKVKEFQNAPYSYHQILDEAIETEPETSQLLTEWYPTSKIKRRIQFGSCRFGGLDFVPDVQDSKLQEGEYNHCEVRESCPGAGIICRAPKINGVAISFLEVKILQQLAGTATNETIAEELSIKLGTLHLMKKLLYEKLKIQTKQEAAMICRDYNLI